MPQITVTTVTGYITSCQGTASASPDIEQFMVSGSNLQGNITFAVPANFEISTSSGFNYYYIINLKNGSDAIAGWVAIVK